MNPNELSREVVSGESLSWKEQDEERTALWGGIETPRPRYVSLASDETRADAAFRLAVQGRALLYRGDYQNARQLLAAMGRRLQKPPLPPGSELLQAFRAHRRAQAEAHRVLSALLVELDEAYRIPLKRAPDVREACAEVWGDSSGRVVVPLRELLGMIGAHEWRRKGIEVPALEGKVHPHFGVFGPIRGEYVDLVNAAPLSGVTSAFDLGTGTGVLALVLARRGVEEILATDLESRAVACARENIERFGYADRIRVERRDLFPGGRADRVVFNPPWMPDSARSRLERAIYDRGNATLLRFLRELPSHLTEGGEAWLVISDLPERLGLKPSGWIRSEVERAGLRILGELKTPASHPRTRDRDDPLHEARSREVTTLYRIAPRG